MPQKIKKPLTQSQKIYLLIKKAVAEVIEEKMPEILEGIFSMYFPEQFEQENENQSHLNALQENLTLIQNQILALSGNGKKKGLSKFDIIAEGTLNERKQSGVNADALRQRYKLGKKTGYRDLNVPEGQDAPEDIIANQRLQEQLQREQELGQIPQGGGGIDIGQVFSETSIGNVDLGSMGSYYEGSAPLQVAVPIPLGSGEGGAMPLMRNQGPTDRNGQLVERMNPKDLGIGATIDPNELFAEMSSRSRPSPPSQ